MQDNQGVVQFRNGSDENAQLRKDKAVGILDLWSIGYFKVCYQKMVNMVESSKTFKMYHYQQVKCKAKTELDQYMRIIGKYSTEKSKRRVDKEEKVGPYKKHDPYPWLDEMIPEDFNLMKRFCMGK